MRPAISPRLDTEIACVSVTHAGISFLFSFKVTTAAIYKTNKKKHKIIYALIICKNIRDVVL